MKSVSRNKFEELRHSDQVDAGVLYVITNSDATRTYGWSPDGRGFYFYGSMAEFRVEH